MYDEREQLDNLVWDENDEDYKSLLRMRRTSTCDEVERLAKQLFGATTTTFMSPISRRLQHPLPNPTSRHLP